MLKRADSSPLNVFRCRVAHQEKRFKTTRALGEPRPPPGTTVSSSDFYRRISILANMDVALLTFTGIYWILRCILTFNISEIYPKRSWIPATTRTNSKTERVLPWPMLRPATKFHANQFGGFCTILRTVRPPNRPRQNHSVLQVK